MVSLGVFYFSKFKKDNSNGHKKKFLELYQDAATLRNPIACYNLYLCYAVGDGVSKDSKISKKYLKLAARLGHRKAIRILNA
jgi:TPR repeat protein